MGVPVDIIGPAGFEISDRALKRAGLDYLEKAVVEHHECWEAFQGVRQAVVPAPRLVLLSSHAAVSYVNYVFRNDDILLLGRESAGVPDYVRAAATDRITIPMRAGLRSLNVAVAAAMVLGEALRQTGGFPSRRVLAGSATHSD
jgi:tRNA (cytidine/uridine-2'-O-)-methyltransferase